MSRTLRRCVGLAAVVFSAACAAPQAPTQAPAATGHHLSAAEQDQLLRGDQVVREQTFEREGSRYVGGVAYQIVEAEPEAVLSAVRDAESLEEMLPRTKSVVEVGREGSHRFEVRQGNDLVEARYTVVLEDAPSKDEVRFFLDEGAHHDIKDVYGYFRVKEMSHGRTLVTVGVALDLGPGLVRMLFEKRIQELMLTTPRRMRDYIERESGSRGVMARGEARLQGAP